MWFSIPDADHLSNARTELLTQLHRHLRHAGIPLGVPGLATVPKVAPLSAIELMEQSDLFGGVEASHRETIAGHLSEIALNAGEVLIQQDMASTALFIVASGTLEVTIQRKDEAPRLVHRMGPGESVGAIGLFTGEPYAATATAMTQVSAYRLDKTAIAAAVAEMPALRDGLEALASRGRAVLRADATAHEHQAAQEPAMFLARLRQFIGLLGT